MLLDVSRGFVRDQAPIEVVRSQLETEAGFDQATWQAMVEMGWAGISLPDTVGGAGMGVGSAVPVFEALGGGLLGTPLLSSTLAGQLIWRAAGESAADWLGRLCAGLVGTVAYLDHGDWGAANMGVTLVRTVNAKALSPMPGWPTVLLCWPTKRRSGLALVERSDIADGALSENVLIDLTKQAANVDFTGVTPSQVVRGDTVQLRRDTLC